MALTIQIRTPNFLLRLIEGLVNSLGQFVVNCNPSLLKSHPIFQYLISPGRKSV